jgi:hypothetical protein
MGVRVKAVTLLVLHKSVTAILVITYKYQDHGLVHQSESLLKMSASSSILPPGIEGELQLFTSGGHDVEWMSFTKRKHYTNAFIVQNGKVGFTFP